MHGCHTQRGARLSSIILHLRAVDKGQNVCSTGPHTISVRRQNYTDDLRKIFTTICFVAVFCCLQPSTHTVNQKRPLLLLLCAVDTCTFNVGKIPKATANCIKHAPRFQFIAQQVAQLASQSAAVDYSAEQKRFDFCSRFAMHAIYRIHSYKNYTKEPCSNCLMPNFNALHAVVMKFGS